MLLPGWNFFLLTSGAPGTVTQGWGLLGAMGVPRGAVRLRVIKRPSARSPLLLLSYGLGDPFRLTHSQGVVAEVRELTEASGATVLVVVCGNSAMSTAAEVKRTCGSLVVVVSIQRPHFHQDLFDLVIAPAHDWIRLPELPCNVFLTQGSLHSVCRESLEASRKQEQGASELLAALCRPLLLVAIGGPTNHCRWEWEDVCAFVCSLADEGRGLGVETVLVATSLRTPSELLTSLAARAARGAAHEGSAAFVLWEGPILPVYAAVDDAASLRQGSAIIATADSVTMVSEACSTLAPVLILGPELCQGKMVAFHHYLVARGRVCPLRLLAVLADARRLVPEAMAAKQQQNLPLDDTPRAAAEVVRLCRASECRTAASGKQTNEDS